MPMDGLTVGFAARELDDILRDGRIDKITQPERDTVVLVIRAGGANHRLLLCASPNNARCHLTMNSYSNPLEPPAMCMLMRKQIAGARITGVRQVEGDRIVHVDMDAVNELGDHVLRRLVLDENERAVLFRRELVDCVMNRQHLAASFSPGLACRQAVEGIHDDEAIALGIRKIEAAFERC